VPVIVYPAPGNETKLVRWSVAGAEVVERDSLSAILDDLGRRRFTNILVEGGAGLLGAFLDAGMVDEYHVFVAPRLVGGRDALAPVGGVGIERMADALRLVEFTRERSGEDVYLHGLASNSFDGITG
jgi:diaminohydroxyphosphoribosylaminopyrimidine deaminase/5-amino-6-(5-phosphoribosylamino)uracil reductase